MHELERTGSCIALEHETLLLDIEVTGLLRTA
jgi:hypothetical protein